MFLSLLMHSAHRYKLQCFFNINYLFILKDSDSKGGRHVMTKTPASKIRQLQFWRVVIFAHETQTSTIFTNIRPTAQCENRSGFHQRRIPDAHSNGSSVSTETSDKLSSNALLVLIRSPKRIP